MAQRHRGPGKIKRVPSVEDRLKEIWQRAVCATDDATFERLTRLYEKIRLADRPKAPVGRPATGPQPGTQKFERDARQQANSDAKEAARKAYTSEQAAKVPLTPAVSPYAPTALETGLLGIVPEHTTKADALKQAAMDKPILDEFDNRSEQERRAASRAVSERYLRESGLVSHVPVESPVLPQPLPPPPSAPNENTDTRPPIQPSPAKASPIVGVWTPEMLALRDRARK
jgi:hypothetical protein